MKTVKSLVLTLLIGASVVACKKGDNDPFLSLKSRDGRVSGEWKLDSYSSKEISILTANAAADTILYESFDYNGSDLVYYYVDSAGTYGTSSDEVDYGLTINKDGSYSSTTTYTYGETTESGNWFWTNNGKNKTGITFDDSENAYEVLELRNKKMVLIKNTTYEMTVDSLDAYLLQTYSEKRTYSKVD